MKYIIDFFKNEALKLIYLLLFWIILKAFIKENLIFFKTVFGHIGPNTYYQTQISQLSTFWTYSPSYTIHAYMCAAVI